MGELIKSLIAFQSECPKIKKGETNPFFKSKYADLPDIWSVIQPILAKHSLAIIQPIVNGCVNTTLIHVTGDKIESNFPIVCKTENNPQDFGSAVTYARRYSLSAILGIVTDEDDDAENAMGRDIKQSQSNIKPKSEKKLDVPTDLPMKNFGTLEDVQFKEGVTDGKPWKRFGIKINGTTYGTFDTKIGEAAQSIIGNPVDFSFVTQGKHKTITMISPVSNNPVASNQDEEDLPF